MALLSHTPLNALRAVEVVTRTGTLGRAADELGVTVGAVSQQVQKAEAALGVVLFERGAAGLRPTAAGARMQPHLDLAFRHLAEAIAAATAEDERALVITCAPSFASRWLIPRLSRFTRDNPGLDLRFIASSAVLDLARGDIDIGLRLGRGDWPDVVAEPLVAQTIFPVCTPALAARLGVPADLARVPIIRDEASMIAWDDWFAAAGAAPMRLTGPTFSDPLLGLEAVLAGQGAMLAWQLLVADALADGRLVRPFPALAASGLAYWLVTPAAKRRSRKVRLFRDWLVAEMATTSAALAAAGLLPAQACPG